MKRVSFLIAFTVANIFCTSPLRAQELIVYSMPAPAGYNWKSPHTLFISYLENMLKPTRYRGNRHLLGHMLVELRDSTRHTVVGAVPKYFSDLRKSILVEKNGLGTMFTRYTGVLESTEENMSQLLDRYPNGDVAYVRFLLSDEMFARLWQYLTEYKARGYDTIYNGKNRPREGAGAGCSAFAVSFIEVGHLLDTATLSQWQVRVNIQDKLIGRPEKQHKVSILKMAFTQRWAKKGKHAFQSIIYYEPTYVYNWIRERHLETDCKKLCRTEVRGHTPGVVIDRRNQPTPTEPIWLDK